MKKFALILLTFLISLSVSAQALTPTDTIQSAVDKIVVIVEKNLGEENTEARRDEILIVVKEVFDFKEMAKRALGSNWSKIDEQEQSEYIELFSKFLAKTYIDKVENIKKDVVKIESEKQRQGKALVKTKVNIDGEDFPIDYKMTNRDSSWQVYDVVIENVGLVTNYRNEFAGIMRKEKFAGLMKRLRKKVNS